MNGKSVVITGGAGFIGSNLAEQLIADNKITIIDDLSTGSLDNIASIKNKRNLTFVLGSILNGDLLEKRFHGIDVVFHEAAIPSVARSVDDPLTTNEVNIQGTLNVLIAAKNQKVGKLVFASSSAVYGDTVILPNKEHAHPNLQSPYALTKLTGEYYCQIFNRLYGLSTICLRYFNVYGPRQNPNSEYAAVIPLFISNILNNNPPVIYGDGNQTRDFIFIKDVIQANILAAESEATGVFNIGAGHSTTVNELAKVIISILGRDLHPIYKEARPGDIRNSLADIDLARSFGYNPRYSLENGLSETIHPGKSILEDKNQGL